jgi:hypothetical protein
VTRVVLAMMVGGLFGLWLGEREPRQADPWFAEALLGVSRHDFARALLAVDERLYVAPDDPAALVLRARVLAEWGCAESMAEGEHALVNGNHGRAASAFARVAADCRFRPFATTRLEQMGAR